MIDEALAGNDASTTTILAPKLCAKDERINNRYYLEFGDNTNPKRMTSSINLNPVVNTNDK